MSKAVCCDRCGSFGKVDAKDYDLLKTHGWGALYDHHTQNYSYLCPPCLKAFNEFMKPVHELKKEAVQFWRNIEDLIQAKK
jgi:hypothetical protein